MKKEIPKPLVFTLLGLALAAAIGAIAFLGGGQPESTALQPGDYAMSATEARARMLKEKGEEATPPPNAPQTP